MSACFKIIVSPSLAIEPARDFDAPVKSRRTARRCHSEIAFAGDFANPAGATSGLSPKHVRPATCR